jgi:hypothetical protein
MLIVVILNAISILLVMGRSFFHEFGHITEEIYELRNQVMLIHGITGGLAMVLGVVFLFKHPPKIRLEMRITAILWTIALLLGIAIYIFHSMNLNAH